jgi:hypothetical protein
MVLLLGVSEGFFRLYFDSSDATHRRTVIRTTFWFTMDTTTLALVLAKAFAVSTTSLPRSIIPSLVSFS